MEKESLYILKLDTQGSKVKFPNADMPAKLGEYTYTAQRMAGTPTLTATLNYPSCLDELWTGEEFVEFRGEKYYIDQVPTSSKDNKSIMYKHELQFVSERIVLENVYFMDVVTAGEDTYHSNSTSVKFMGDINEFVGRLNASMAKSGIGYSIVIDEDITSESKLVSLDSVYLAEALQSIYTIYELPYYFVGKVCYIGYTENVISTPFEYKKGLVSIKKTNANYKTVNRVTGVGSSDNIPFYYPNDDEKGTIERTQNLMPSIYRQTNGAERFYNALNDTYKIPGTNDYYFFKNTYSSKKVKEIKVDFSDIKPTIENVTNASGQLFGEIADIAFDDNDSDELGTGEGNNIFNGTDEYVHSYFYIKLHIYNGDYGFNLFEQGLEGGTAVINMTTGNCAACEFEIGVTYKDNEPGRAFNPVLVDSSGNLPAGDFEQKVTSQTSQYIESQQNTSTNEVWIAVKKDNTTFGVVMPNATNNYKPSVGDKFVITGIKMPKSLVLAAEKRLDEALIKYMSENNDEKFSFSVSFSRVFLAENSMLAGLLNENSCIYIKYNDKEYFMYVNSFTCKADKNCLYDISVELTDKLSANVSALRSTITEIAGDIIGERMGVSLNVSDILGRISRYFISKINNDTANGLITFLKGLKIAGNLINRIVKQGDKDVTYTDEDVMSALRVMTEIENSAEKLKEIFVRKDKEDSTNFLLSLLGGTVIKKYAKFGDFIDSMIAGKGAGIYPDGRGQFERLEVRGSAVFKEVIYNRLNAQEGDTSYSENGVIESVTLESDGTYTLKLRKRWENDFTAFQEGDVVYGIVNNLFSTGEYYTSWVRVLSKNIAANSISVLVYPDSEVPGGRNYPPTELMIITRRGNAINEDRQSYWYLSATTDKCLVWLEGVTKPVLEQNNYYMILGRLPNLDLFDNLPVNYKHSYIFARAGIFGELYRVDWQGLPVQELVDRGFWSAEVASSDNPYTNTQERADTVWHYGCKWKCLMTGTADEPQYAAAGWAMLEGNPEFTIEIGSTKGWYFDIETFSTTLYITGKLYNRDVTDHILDADVSWTRDTGNVSEDNAWAVKRAGAGKNLPLTTDDLGPNYTNMRVCTFKAQALLRDGQQFEVAENFVTF